MREDRGKEEVRRRFDSLARKRSHWKARNKYYYDDQEKYYRFLVPEGISVLELGCGTGDLVHALKPRRGVGIDFSPEMIKIASELYPELEFRAADVEELENWGESFDILIMADVVGHLRDIEETFRGLRSFCRPETRFIVSYYNFLWEPILKIGEVLNLKMPQQYQNWLSSEDICNLLSPAKFQIVKTECLLLIGKDQEVIFVEGDSTDGTFEEIGRVIHAYSDRDIKLISHKMGREKGMPSERGFQSRRVTF